MTFTPIGMWSISLLLTAHCMVNFCTSDTEDMHQKPQSATPPQKALAKFGKPDQLRRLPFHRQRPSRRLLGFAKCGRNGRKVFGSAWPGGTSSRSQPGQVVNNVDAHGWRRSLLNITVQRQKSANRNRAIMIRLSQMGKTSMQSYCTTYYGAGRNHLTKGWTPEENRLSKSNWQIQAFSSNILEHQLWNRLTTTTAPPPPLPRAPNGVFVTVG